MRFLDVTLPSLNDNLALDEALLMQAEAEGGALLRFWEWPGYAVVLGAGGHRLDDVDLPRCEADAVAITRRGSGGGTVLLGPGCLLYSVVLPFDLDPALADVKASYVHVMRRILDALQPHVPALNLQGGSDLAIGDRKISGNAQQRKRTHLLQHGTLLYGFDLPLIARYLKQPQRQPDYRQQRGHDDFVTNLPLAVATIKSAIRATWQADGEVAELPLATAQRLVEEKYGRDDWVMRR
jgi:lipoate-protein ligase A